MQTEHQQGIRLQRHLQLRVLMQVSPVIYIMDTLYSFISFLHMAYFSSGVQMLAATTARAAACTLTTATSCHRLQMEQLGSFITLTLTQTMSGLATATDTSVCLNLGKTRQKTNARRLFGSVCRALSVCLLCLRIRPKVEQSIFIFQATKRI